MMAVLLTAAALRGRASGVLDGAPGCFERDRATDARRIRRVPKPRIFYLDWDYQNRQAMAFTISVPKRVLRALECTPGDSGDARLCDSPSPLSLVPP
jgi:hypothetical protein